LAGENSGGSISFYTNPNNFNTAVTERMRINRLGNVGIGNTGPSVALEIGAATGAAQVDANVLRVNRSVTGQYAEFSAALGAATINGVNGSGGGVRFLGDGTERARIDTSGRLLVGTSTSVGTGTATGASIQINSSSGLVVRRNSADTGPSNITFGKSRNATDGSYTIVNSGDGIGSLRFAADDGTDMLSLAATIEAFVDGTPGANDMPGRLVFSTTAGGASSPTERMRINNAGAIFFPGIGTTASAANAFLNSGSSPANQLLRSTSSLRYKTDIENIEEERSDAILDFRPVWYRSTAEADRNDWSWYGLIAEEVAETEPRLVHWTYLDDAYEEVDGEKQLKPDAEMVPDGVQYDRLTVLLLDVVKRQQQAIETLEAKVAALESA
jgi:hypothetical protein